jgi:adenylosuccinate lyase
MTISTLTAISPLDGRYAEKCAPLRSLASEYALMRFRLEIEVEWLIALSHCAEISELAPFDTKTEALLRELVSQFSENDALRIKEIEKTTRHDVKAIEYFLAEKLSTLHNYASIRPFIHFACTSEDINNLSYALMLKQIRFEILIPSLTKIITKLTQMAHDNADVPMLARTHGQTASPTTMGKEIANVVFRLKKELETFRQISILGKCNGAVGNFNAHVIAYPEVDWETFTQHFVEKLDLSWNRYTTQIEPHDWISAYSQALVRCHTILIDLCRDCWGYISLGYFKQSTVAGEVGSSTMPHKVNPIDFENAEGNFGISNALLTHFSEKLPISRWQRDLSDSTVLRNLGVAAGHGLLAYESLLVGLNKLVVNKEQLAADLENSWEVIAEAIQTVMRRYGITDAYEQLKAFSRGKRVEKDLLIAFIDSQPLPENAKVQLKALTPESYIGLAEKLAKELA